MTNFIDIADLTKTFADGQTALKEVSFCVQRGEFVSLLGPSGCGKTTILRTIAGLEEASEGTVQVDADGRRRGGTGLVFQNAVLMPWASVFDNVWMPLRLAGQTRHEAGEAVQAMLALVGLTDRAQSYPRHLSGGMQMRVAIVRALITQPDLLLLDEPFAALDEITRNELNRELLELHTRHGFTTVFVTHSVTEAVFLSQRIVVMASKPGRVHAEINVAHEGPRDLDYRSSSLFAKRCGQVSTALVEATAVAQSFV
ncbi:MAG: ABC transporter ATP-binding protein [Ahrensia sp.]|nr:ABC transporter ATP-binding protein [Ahrensia sp.]